MSQHYWNTAIVCWKGSWKSLYSKRRWSKLPLSNRAAMVLYTVADSGRFAWFIPSQSIASKLLTTLRYCC